MYMTQELGSRNDKIENEVIVDEVRVTFVIDKMKKVRFEMALKLDM